MNFFEENNLNYLETSLNIFEYMARLSTHKDNRWTCYFNKSSTKIVTNFLIKLAKNKIIVGDSFLWTYSIFQFQFQAKCWKEGLENYNSGEVKVDKVFGPKAYERWINRDQDFDWAIQFSSFTESFNISKFNFFKKYPPKKHLKPTLNVLSHRRQRFNNDVLKCFKLTGGYDSLDASCLLCQNKIVCLEFQKITENLD